MPTPSDPLYINPGDLRHSITIQAANATEPDEYGQIADAWTPILTTRAGLESTNSPSYRDSFSNNALAAASTDLFTVRWPGAAISLEPGQRIVLGSNIWTIQAVDNVMRRNRKVRIAALIIDSGSN